MIPLSYVPQKRRVSEKAGSVEWRFERAIQYNPECTEALRELRLMNMRREKEAQEKKSLLDKMFGK